MLFVAFSLHHCCDAMLFSIGLFINVCKSFPLITHHTEYKDRVLQAHQKEREKNIYQNSLDRSTFDPNTSSVLLFHDIWERISQLGLGFDFHQSKVIVRERVCLPMRERWKGRKRKRVLDSSSIPGGRESEEIRTTLRSNSASVSSTGA